jgi:(E)-4-hydroxy-3-methylbut-2-enyl-diphosphate synthase
MQRQTMSVRPYRDIQRRKSRQIFVGKVPVGGDAPIAVQTMTNTLTTDVAGTVEQIRMAEEAGADIVRVSCPDEESTAALKQIIKQVTVPIVADIHFHYKRAIEAAEAGAACLRINPGNIGSDERVKEVVKAAKDHGCSMRIGVNAGSLERELLERYGEPCPEAMVESAQRHIQILEDNDFREFKISVKASDVFLAVAAYNGLAEACDYPLHLGITEAGGLIGGTVKSAIGIGNMLWSGIGDTIRVSLTPAPNGDRTEEVQVAQQILQSMQIRSFTPQVTACPGCGRTTSTFFQEMAEQIQSYLREQMPVWKTRYSGVEEMKVAVMGCVVNGPGESKHSNIGISLPGTFEEPKAPVYVDGRLMMTLKGDHIVAEFIKILDDYVNSHYAAKERQLVASN